MTYPRLTLDRGALFLGGGLLALLVVALQPSANAVQGGSQTGTPAPVVQQLPTFPAIGMADSNGQMIAVTGIDLTGSSILYLVDTQNRQLAVYQANGGSDSMQGLKLVGARKIDFDLKLEGYNDKSQYTYEDLEKKFAENKRTVAPPPKKP
ncbi:MAG: hypothetical protein JNL28_08455 [Planctomycetes bacterium]|nr:hypothetical protein [Planctomycetota bacterium]